MLVSTSWACVSTWGTTRAEACGLWAAGLAASGQLALLLDRLVLLYHLGMADLFKYAHQQLQAQRQATTQLSDIELRLRDAANQVPLCPFGIAHSFTCLDVGCRLICAGSPCTQPFNRSITIGELCGANFTVGMH